MTQSKLKQVVNRYVAPLLISGSIVGAVAGGFVAGVSHLSERAAERDRMLVEVVKEHSNGLNYVEPREPTCESSNEWGAYRVDLTGKLTPENYTCENEVAHRPQLMGSGPAYLLQKCEFRFKEAEKPFRYNVDQGTRSEKTDYERIFDQARRDGRRLDVEASSWLAQLSGEPNAKNLLYDLKCMKLGANEK